MPNTLSGMLGAMPAGIQGYELARQSNQAQGMNELTQAQGAMGLLAKIRQEQMERAFRSELEALGPNATDEQRLAIGAKYLGPKDLVSHTDAAARIGATKEMAMARLQQAAQQQNQNYQIAVAKLAEIQDAGKRAEATLALNQWKAQTDLGFKQQAAQIASGRYTYDTGNVVGNTSLPPMPETGAVARTAAPQGALPANVPPSDAAAYQAARSGGSGTVNRVMGPQETAGMQVMGEPAPQPIQQPEPASQVAAPVTSAKPAPEMPPHIKAMIDAIASPKERDKARAAWTAQQTRQDIRLGAVDNMTPADRDYYAAYVLLNGRMPIGMSRIGPEATQAIMSRAAQRASEMGMKPEDFAAAGPIVRTKLGALVQLEKNANAVQAYEGMLVKNVDILKTISDKVPRTKSPLLNRPILWLRNNASGDPDVAEYLFQVNTVATEVARVLNNPNLTGQLTDTARRELEGVVNGNYGHDQLMQVLTRARADAENRSKSFDEQKSKVIKEIRSFGEGGTGTATKPGVGPYQDPEKERRYQEWKRSQGMQ